MTEKLNITETLETLIDQSSLLDVLTGLVLVCAEKADHIQANWQDTTSARAWRSDSVLIENLLHKLHT